MSKGEKKRVLIISNHHSYTYNFRKEIIQKLLDEGYAVYLTLPFGDKVKKLEEMGCIYIESSLDRRGMNPRADFRLIITYYNIIKNIKPNVVLSYTIKPNIYGGLVCRMLGIPFIASVTGLGTAVGNDGYLQKILIRLYRVAFKKACCVFFQNESNKDFFKNNNISISKTRIIPGSGVNLEEFPYENYPEDGENLRFLFIGRVMKDKGIEELIAAARIIKSKYKSVHFDALGFCEDDYSERAQELEKEGIINFHGVTNDVRGYLKKCNAVIHPSHHEGMSNVLLESAATGRPVLASNIPGCLETFEDHISGYGFASKNVNSLVEAIDRFIGLPYEKKKAMGIAGREKIKREYDRKIVVNAYFDEINKAVEDDSEPRPIT